MTKKQVPPTAPYLIGAISCSLWTTSYNKNRSIVLTIDSEKAVLATIIKIFDEEGIAIGNIAADYYERKEKKLLKLKIAIEHRLSQEKMNQLVVKISEKVNPLTIVSR